MKVIEFDTAFRDLTGNDPFPWQRSLYERFAERDFPESCNLPTGLGKTNVIAVWLIAFLNNPAKVPRRLVYVVNRRTVVDQTTTEVEKIRANLHKLTTIPEARHTLAISTLRGQFADNREWSADPSRPAVICGTVDMIGSRLLFSGYGVGFKGKPLHAGFLGQDALLVHDEAHLEPAFQRLLIAIQAEQTRCNEFRSFRVMELTATSRSGGETFPNDSERRANEEHETVQRRISAKKLIRLHEIGDENKLADSIVELALEHRDSGRPILVFVRKVDDVEKIVARLRTEDQHVQQLTGTLRGLERDRMVDPRKETGCPIFARFLPPPPHDAPEQERWKVLPQLGTVYLVCTSAGEVGVNISADHLVCDLTTFESMAQRFGRVNRFGNSADTRIDIVHPRDFDDDDYDQRRVLTLALLKTLDGDGSSKALGQLAEAERTAAFAPTPIILPVTDILFDAWALTTIREKLPGRPPVAPYLHGVSEWEPAETHVAWREEVGVITGARREDYDPEDLLEEYPLKPHELLRDRSDRVFKHIVALAARRPADPVWLLDDDGNVEVLNLEELAGRGKKDRIEYKTILLTPDTGGLETGLLNSASLDADDVADQWFLDADRNVHRRIRFWDDDEEPADVVNDFRLIREIVLTDDENEDAEPAIWRWYVRPTSADDDGSKTAKTAITWLDHTKDVVNGATSLADGLLKDQPNLHKALVLSAHFHDLGKKREVWQRSIGHNLPPDPKPDDWLAKSGPGMKPLESTTYRHEFGSLLDVMDQPEFTNLNDNHLQELILHLIAVHHGYGRPHFPPDQAIDPRPPMGRDVVGVAADVPQRFARLQRKYGRWGLAYLESLLRAADWAASANPSNETPSREELA